MNRVLFHFSLFTAEGYIDLESTELKDIKSSSHILDRNTIYVAVNPMQNSELNSNYLVGGIGVVISFFFIHDFNTIV